MLDQAVEDWIQTYGIPIGLSLFWGAITGIVAVLLFRVATLAIVRDRSRAKSITRRVNFALFMLVMLIASWIAALLMRVPRKFDEGVYETMRHWWVILIIVFAAYLLTRIVATISSLIMREFAPEKDVDPRRAGRVLIQVQLMRRVAIAIIIVVAAGAILFTFPAARAAGASLLASAGLVSVVAGLAAQSMLTNVFAGMQLAFSGAINLHDIVVVENEWGTIEEITLTYVVVRIWDDRRLVLPSTYFTTTPFANWSRTSDEITGEVYLDVDWNIPVPEIRKELKRIVDATELWDGRVAVLQVIDASGGYVRLRVLVSAEDSAYIFDLRNHVRESLVTWIREVHPEAMPFQRMRIVQDEAPETAPRRRGRTETGPVEGLFFGSEGAEGRRDTFTKPMDVLTPEEIEAARAVERESK